MKFNLDIRVWRTRQSSLVCSEPGRVHSSQRILDLRVRPEGVELWLVQDGVPLARAAALYSALSAWQNDSAHNAHLSRRWINGVCILRTNSPGLRGMEGEGVSSNQARESCWE